jgi:hypothetical protein
MVAVHRYPWQTLLEEASQETDLQKLTAELKKLEDEIFDKCQHWLACDEDEQDALCEGLRIIRNLQVTKLGFPDLLARRSRTASM